MRSLPRVRRGLRIGGIVQGVGFRPFVYGLARELGLAGFVRNGPAGVEIEVEGSPGAIEEFQRRLTEHPPPLARIDAVEAYPVEPTGVPGFQIERSEQLGAPSALISPDVAICEECLAEISDPKERRYRYAFTNCTNCGPRFTITVRVPYDRATTTMARFQMCARCAAEYHDPADRRFHAQPIACPECGPSLRLVTPSGAPVAGDPLHQIALALVGGSVVAVKGLGGYHLACDALNEDAVAALRARKHREDKPFALMARDLATVRGYCELSKDEEALLASRRRPIVLAARRDDAEPPLAAAVAPGNPYLGFMLPYTPLHHLLLDAFVAAGGAGVLVMTSGNVSDEPICYRDDDALERLGKIADLFLQHDRDIHMRCDDSVARIFRGGEYLVRRARGYVPEPLLLTPTAPCHLLAVGAELKHTFCLAKGERAFLSHHIGDLENWETMRSFFEGVEHFTRAFDVHPEAVAYDLHPEYLSTKWALERVAGSGGERAGVDLEGAPAIGVQHHHAHIASCLADNARNERVIGLALDGTGWGEDGTIWGCEVLVADLVSYERVGHLTQLPLPGGAAAIKEPWRMAAAYLEAAFGERAAMLPLAFVEANAARWGPVLAAARAGVNSPLTSSAGRLFDAVAALCGVRATVNYEGQAAIELEALAHRAGDVGAYDCPVADGEIDGVALFRACAEDLAHGTAPEVVAARMHAGFATALARLVDVVAVRTGLGVVALSGGTFQNLLLTRRLVALLEERGFEVLLHRKVPPNDGGIALGQAAVAAARLARRPTG